MSHPSEQEKIASGLPIVEIRIHNEEDIEPLKVGIDATSSSVHCYNLPPLEPIEQRCLEPCNVPITMLLLYANGKAWYSQTSSASMSDLIADHSLIAWEIVRVRNVNSAYDQVATLDQFKKFIVQQKYERDRDVKTCMICRHNGGQKTKNDIFCHAKNRIMWMSSSACGCSSYLPAENAQEAISLLDQNLERLPF